MKRILKKISTLIIGTATLVLCACSGNSDEIVIGEDGSNNRNAIVSFIDDYSFYIDYIEYQMVGSHIEVVGYDEIEHVTYVKPYAKITIDGTTYETKAIRGKCKERRFSDGTLVNYFSALPRSLEKIDIPSTVTEIGEGAFANLNIGSIVIPEGVVSIGDGAFSGCQNLDSISLPSTLRFIEDSKSKCKTLRWALVILLSPSGEGMPKRRGRPKPPPRADSSRTYWQYKIKRETEVSLRLTNFVLLMYRQLTSQQRSQIFALLQRKTAQAEIPVHMLN